ncbi:MAG: glycoside hydrolase family 5 protein [Defluviitaleaceae bacterium]|nr:glycoside hydrolase family 5 protein [Defluviitaleaceae bacterium]
MTVLDKKERMNMKKLFLLMLLVVFAGCAVETDIDVVVDAEVILDLATPAPTPVPTPAPTPAPVATAIVVSPGVVTDDFAPLTATEWVGNIRMGWNLGNTLDTHSDTGVGFSWLGGGDYTTTTVYEMEMAWGNPITTRETIETVRDAGFNAIRIPVTWHKAADEFFIIREDWMTRVTTVVDYAMEAGLQVLLNTHHDNKIFRLHDDYMEDSKFALERIWTQIAYHFRDYGSALAFNGLNEPRTIGSRAEWSGGTPEERHNLNLLNQVFVDAVRATGGNNTARVLVVPTYAASSSAVAQNDFVLPEDIVDDRIVLTLHLYAPWEFALRTGPEGTIDVWSADNPSDTDPITVPLDMAYVNFVSQGIPVIFGEMGALNRDNEPYRAALAEFYVGHARSLGIPCFWWDNGEYHPSRENPWGWDETFGILNRRANEFAHPMILDALMRATARDCCP